MQLIGQRISQGQTLTDSHVGLGDQILVATTGAATAAGNVAGLVLAAPVAVVDQDTRDNYAAHVGGLRGRKQHTAGCGQGLRSDQTDAELQTLISADGCYCNIHRHERLFEAYFHRDRETAIGAIPSQAHEGHTRGF